jgi:hypothetical protein
VAVVDTEHIDKHSVPYRVELESIADVQANAAQLGDHGHPQHVVTSP